MTVQISLRPGLSEFAADAVHRVRSVIARRRETPVGPEDDCHRRQFIQDMLTRNPDAFSSELDVQHMMHCFPGRF